MRMILWLVLAAGFALTGVRAEVPRWTFGDADTQITLVATIDVSPVQNWIDADLAARLNSAAAIYVKIDPADRVPERAERLLGQYALLGKGASLERQITRTHYRMIAEQLSASGLQPRDYNTFRPWFAVLLARRAALTAAGIDSSHETEPQLARYGAARGIEVRGLESYVHLLTVFLGLTPAEEARFVAAQLTAMPGLEAATRAQDRAWRAGDLERAAAAIRRPFADLPGLALALFEERSAGWAPVIVRLLEEPGRFVVAVDAASLVGPAGLLARLGAAGLRPERVRFSP